jgi:protein-S-isoprenylcysteine O-methyltransferase Ste14
MIALGLPSLFESIARFVVIGRGTLVPAVPTQHLVVSGLYRYVRNPMYLGVVIAIAGESLLFPSRSMLIYLVCVWLAMHLFVCLYEERNLARTYGMEYERFKQNVPRWIPRLSSRRPS